LYGTWVRSTPADTLNSSAARWLLVAMPDDEKFSLPGLALASATSSLIEWMGRATDGLQCSSGAGLRLSFAGGTAVTQLFKAGGRAFATTT